MENIQTIYEGVIVAIEKRRKAIYKAELEYQTELALVNDTIYQTMHSELLNTTEVEYKPYIQAAIDLRIAHLRNPIIDSLTSWYVNWDEKQLIKAKIALLIEKKEIDLYNFETLVDTVTPQHNEKAN